LSDVLQRLLKVDETREWHEQEIPAEKDIKISAVIDVPT
jgi:hypothetical protein